MLSRTYPRSVIPDGFLVNPEAPAPPLSHRAEDRARQDRKPHGSLLPERPARRRPQRSPGGGRSELQEADELLPFIFVPIFQGSDCGLDSKHGEWAEFRGQYFPKSDRPLGRDRVIVDFFRAD